MSPRPRIRSLFTAPPCTIVWKKPAPCCPRARLMMAGNAHAYTQLFDCTQHSAISNQHPTLSPPLPPPSEGGGARLLQQRAVGSATLNLGKFRHEVLNSKL